jgi:hypothetical protein
VSILAGFIFTELEAEQRNRTTNSLTENSKQLHARNTSGKQLNSEQQTASRQKYIR